jgi:virulence factor
VIRLGLVGTNTSHAPAFASIINGNAERAARVEGARIVAVWGDSSAESLALEADRKLLTAPALAETYGIEQVVDQPVAMIGHIDAVLVVDDLGLGARHGTLAQPFVDAGIPTFIDKPMTLDLAEAVTLFDLAEQRGSPLMSTSALRFAHEVADMRTRMADLGALSSVTSVGPGDWFNYGVHAVEMFQTLVGPGARWVHAFSEPARDVVVIGYDERPTVVVQTLRDANYVFHLAAYAEKGWDECEVTDADGFYSGMMAAVLEMVRTGRAPVNPANTLEILAILHAGERSAQTGQRVNLASLIPG